MPFHSLHSSHYYKPSSLQQPPVDLGNAMTGVSPKPVTHAILGSSFPKQSGKARQCIINYLTKVFTVLNYFQFASVHWACYSLCRLSSQIKPGCNSPNKIDATLIDWSCEATALGGREQMWLGKRAMGWLGLHSVGVLWQDVTNRTFISWSSVFVKGKPSICHGHPHFYLQTMTLEIKDY
jgi:hypothetical protein